MHFYEALKFVLNTSQGKIKRLNWNDDSFLKREISDGKVIINMNNKNGSYLYHPTNDDLTANDWMIVKEE